VVALPAILLLAYTITVRIQEFNRFQNRNDEYDFDQFEAYVEPYFNVSELAPTPDEIAAGGGLDALTAALGSAGQYLGLIGIGLLHRFVMIAVAFYLLRDDHRLSRWVTHRFGDEAGVLEAYLDAVESDTRSSSATSSTRSRPA